MTTYNVVDVENVRLDGQVAIGHAVGVRVNGVDAVIFAPTYADGLRLAAMLPPGELYGEQQATRRSLLISERQVTPRVCPEVDPDPCQCTRPIDL